MPWWDPASWWSAAGDLTSDVISDIEGWVKRAINLALTAYDDAVGVVIRGIDDFLAEISRAVNAADSVIASLYDYAVNIVDSVIPRAIDWLAGQAWGWVQDAYHDALAGIDQLGQWAQDAVNAVVGSLDWLYQNVLLPVAHWVENAGQWVAQVLASWWDTIWRDVIAPVFADVAWLVDNVPGWISWLEHVAYDEIQLLIKAGDWIEWFAVHSFDDLWQLAAGAPRAFTSSWLSSSASDLDAAAQDVENFLASLLGV